MVVISRKWRALRRSRRGGRPPRSVCPSLKSEGDCAGNAECKWNAKISKCRKAPAIKKKMVKKTPPIEEKHKQLLKKMRAHIGEFVLVIGSNNSQPYCFEFAKSPENRDKMVISIDLYLADVDIVNNFKLDFNKIETWNMLHEFDGRFRNIIFDKGTQHYISLDIDYRSHIKRLLIIGGKMYCFFTDDGDISSIPRFIPTSKFIREITHADINIIKHQYPDIPDESIEKLGAISVIMFTKTPFGLKRWLDTEFPYDIVGLDKKDKDQLIFKNDALGRNLQQYMKALFLFYEQFTEIRILQEVYGFKTDLFKECIDYPFKYPEHFIPRLRTEDICFIVCTKQ